MSVKTESSLENLSNRKTNLIVNYLPQTITDENFRVLFAKHGDIRSARIIRNKTTGYSYGFGFVDYFNTEDAVRAIKKLNGSVLNHKRIKVSYARPSGDEIKNANLFVSNLPFEYTEDDVRLLFSNHGEIIQCRLLGNRAGTAFVLFNLHEQAKEAMSSLNNYSIPGSSLRISIKFAVNEQKKSLKPERNNYNGNNMAHTLKSQKRPYSSQNNDYNYSTFPNSKYPAQNFEPSGPIRNTSHHNRYNPLSHQAQFYPPSLLPANMSSMYSNSMHGGQPYVKMNDYCPLPSHFNGNENDNDEHILFVYNIGPDTNEFYLGQLFSNYGKVLRVNVIRRGNSGESRGYGFVTMKYYQDAVNAINALDGHKYANNKPLQVSFKKI